MVAPQEWQAPGHCAALPSPTCLPPRRGRAGAGRGRLRVRRLVDAADASGNLARQGQRASGRHRSRFREEPCPSPSSCALPRRPFPPFGAWPPGRISQVRRVCKIAQPFRGYPACQIRGPPFRVRRAPVRSGRFPGSAQREARIQPKSSEMPRNYVKITRSKHVISTISGSVGTRFKPREQGGSGFRKDRLAAGPSGTGVWSLFRGRVWQEETGP